MRLAITRSESWHRPALQGRRGLDCDSTAASLQPCAHRRRSPHAAAPQRRRESPHHLQLRAVPFVLPPGGGSAPAPAVHPRCPPRDSATSQLCARYLRDRRTSRSAERFDSQAPATSQRYDNSHPTAQPTALPPDRTSPRTSPSVAVGAAAPRGGGAGGGGRGGAPPRPEPEATALHKLGNLASAPDAAPDAAADAAIGALAPHAVRRSLTTRSQSARRVPRTDRERFVTFAVTVTRESACPRLGAPETVRRDKRARLLREPGASFPSTPLTSGALPDVE